MKYDIQVNAICSQITNEDVDRETDIICKNIINEYAPLDNYLDVLFLITAYRKTAKCKKTLINGGHNHKPPAISKENVNNIIDIEMLLVDTESLYVWGAEKCITDIDILNDNIIKYRKFLDNKLKEKLL